jgi:hypothetical protein
MRHLLIGSLAVGLMAVSPILATAAESKAGVALRVAETRDESMVEFKVGSLVFLAPYLKVPRGGWPTEGDVRPIDGAVQFTGVNGSKYRAAMTYVDPNAASGKPTTSRTKVSLRSVKTPDGQMVEFKFGVAIVFAPYLKIVEGGRETEIRPLRDKLICRRQKNESSFSSMTFQPPLVK